MQGAVPSVEVRVIGEVAGRGGLAGGDEGHEVVTAHGRTGVVGGALPPDGRLLLGREVLAARGAGAVCGEDPYLVRQAHQLVLHAVVQHRAEFLGGHTEGGEQVGAPHVPDEQGVARQHAVGHGVRGVLVHEDADGLGRVPGGFHDLQGDVPQADPLPLREVAHRVLGPGPASVADPGTGPGRHLQVPGHEVRVEMGVDDADDGETASFRVGKVLGDVASWIHDDGVTTGLVGDHVRRLGQAVQVVLGEEHRKTSGTTGGHIGPLPPRRHRVRGSALSSRMSHTQGGM